MTMICEGCGYIRRNCRCPAPVWLSQNGTWCVRPRQVTPELVLWEICKREEGGWAFLIDGADLENIIRRAALLAGEGPTDPAVNVH